jgi:hypothetical protein
MTLPRRAVRTGPSAALLGALLVWSMAISACSSDEGPAATDSSEPPTPAEPSASTNELADGSGCTPPSATDLPDGEWYGVVDNAGDGQLVFDLACWFTGDAAVIAAAEDGRESPPPNDYHTRNANDLLRTIEVDAGAPVTSYPDGDPANVVTVAYDQWRIDRESRAYNLAVWLTIEGGIVVAIDEQWVP